MKNVFFLCALLFGTISATAQLKIWPNGYVATNNTSTTPIYPVQFFINTVGMTGTSRPLVFAIGATDPRIQTTSGGKIVFYNTANNAHIDIEVRSIITTSDAKLKTNVAAIGAKSRALAMVKQLKGVEFDFIDDVKSRKHAGFIAQDLEKVLPHLVSTDDSVGNKAIDYQAIIPYLVEAIKEQQVQIDQLKQKLSASTTDTNGIEKRLAGEATRDEKRLIHLAMNPQE